MLALTSSERELLRFAKDNCESVVVVICSSSAMELAALEDDPDVDALLWLGGAGSTGYVALAAILRGEQRVTGGFAGLKGDQRAAQPRGDLALHRLVALEHGAHHALAVRVGEEIAAIAKQPARGDEELQTLSLIHI